MEEQLISFETAKLAKEKGFTQNPYVISYSYRYEFTDYTGCILSNSLFNPSSNICTVPTQSLLAKWLREEHNIYVSPRESYAFDGTLDFVCTVNGVFVNHNFKDKPINRFENFEEAYEIGLQEALKLI